MYIRFLGHDGLYHYFAGTTATGELMWSTDSDFGVIFLSESSAQRIAQRARQEGMDVEVSEI